MTLRHFMSWKPLYYQAFLPALGHLPAHWSDGLLQGLGRLIMAARPKRRHEVLEEIARVDAAMGAGWNHAQVASDLCASLPAFFARDYLLDGLSDVSALARFEVEGEEALKSSLAEGRGAIIVGSHLGAHVAGLHWLYRRGISLRALVQRPNHVSRYLQRRFDEPGPHDQCSLFLRRGLPPCEATDKLLHAHSALRSGMAVYLTGDIPWTGCNTRPGRLLGNETEFLSVWADLAVLTRAPVFVLFCTQATTPGKYRLRLEPMGVLRAGEEGLAVAQFLARLDAEIVAKPAQAVGHLLCDHYRPTGEKRRIERHRRVSKMPMRSNPDVDTSQVTTSASPRR